MKKYFDIPAPSYGYYYFQSIIDKESLFQRYNNLARSKGLSQCYFILSFDCDTDEDSNVVWKVHARLQDIGIKPVYVVTGKLLEKSAPEYRRVFATGAEFLNHGYREHTYFDASAGKYASCFFYDRLSCSEIEEDIRKGDRALLSVLGQKPAGFRAPHFGTFQKPENLAFLRSLLKKMDYRFSSSTVPYYGFRYGPWFEQDGIKEFPLSGAWSKPLSILDSWSCFKAPERTMNGQDYLREALHIASYFKEKGIAGILNFYADPSHIADSDEFFDSVKAWKSAGENISYSGLIKLLSHEKI